MGVLYFWFDTSRLHVIPCIPPNCADDATPTGVFADDTAAASAFTDGDDIMDGSAAADTDLDADVRDDFDVDSETANISEVAAMSASPAAQLDQESTTAGSSLLL